MDFNLPSDLVFENLKEGHTNFSTCKEEKTEMEKFSSLFSVLFPEIERFGFLSRFKKQESQGSSLTGQPAQARDVRFRN